MREDFGDQGNRFWRRRSGRSAAKGEEKEGEGERIRSFCRGRWSNERDGEVLNYKILVDFNWKGRYVFGSVERMMGRSRREWRSKVWEFMIEFKVQSFLDMMQTKLEQFGLEGPDEEYSSLQEQV